MAAPELRLKVTLDTSFLKGQISRLPLDFAGANVSIRPKFDRQTIANEFRLLNRYIGSKKFNITIASNLDAEIKNADRLVKALGRVQQAASGAKGGLPIGTQVLSRTKTKGGFAAAEIKALFGAAVQGGLIDDKTLASTRTQMVTALGSIGRDSIAGLLNGLKSGDADIQNAAKFLGNNLIASFKTVLGIASPSREFKKIGESAGQGFEQGLLKSIEIAEQSATRKMQRMLDRLARMALMMSGMSGPEIGRQVAQARALPSLNFGATTPRSPVSIGPSSTGRALPPGASRPELPGTAFGRQKYLPTALGEELKEVLRGAANAFLDSIRQNIRAVTVTDMGTPPSRQGLLQGGSVAGFLPGRASAASVLELNNILAGAIREYFKSVAREIEYRLGSIGKTPLSTTPLLEPSRIAGLLPGRPSAASVLELNNILAGAIREYFEAVARDVAGAGRAPMSTTPLLSSASPRNQLMLPPAGGTTANLNRPRTTTGSFTGRGYEPPGGFASDGMLGGRQGPATFIGAGSQMEKFKTVLDVATASTQNFRASQIPLIGGIKSLAGEFGEATKQVLLYGTAYKGLAFLTSLPGQVLNAAKSQQQFNNGLKVATQETGTFAKELLYVDNVQRAFGLNLETTRTGFTRLYASMSPTGFDSGSIEKLFTGISAATAALQLTPDKAERVIYAFGQMASKGQIMSEELKGQLGDVLPGALAIFSKAAGMSVKEFSKAMEDGEFTGNRFREVFAKVSDELMNRFGTGAQVAGRSLQGLINTVGGDFQRTLESFAPLANAAAQATLGPLTGMLREVSMAAQIAMGEQDRVRKQLEAAQTDVSTLKAGGADAKEIKAAEQNVAALAAKYEVLNEAARDPAIAQQVKNIEAFVAEVQKAATFTINFAGVIGSVLSPLFAILGGNLTSVIGNLAALALGFNAAKLAALLFMGVMNAMRAIEGISRSGAVSVTLLTAAYRALGVQITAAQVATLGATGATTGFSLAIKGLLISTGIGAVIVLLGSLAAAFLSVGNSAKAAADKAKRSIDSMADAARTGNVAMIEMELAINKADRQDLESLIKNVEDLKGTKGARGVELVALTPEMKREAKRLGIEVAGEVSRGSVLGSLKGLRAPLAKVVNEGSKDLEDARKRAESLGMNKPTPGVTPPETPGDGTGKPPKEQSLESYYSLQDQLAKNFTQAEINRLQAMHDQRMALQNEFFNQQEARANSFQKESIKFQRELASIENERKTALLKASLEVMRAQGSVAGGAAPMGAATAGKTGLFQGSTGVSSGAHFDVRRQDGAYISPEQARALFDPSVRKQLAMTSAYGPRRAPVPGASTFHRGVDLTGPANTPLNLAAGYAMTGAGEKGGLGYAASVRGPQGEMYDVGHLQRPKAGAVAPRKVAGSEKRDLVAAQQVQIANSQQITTGLNAEELAYEKTKTAIANYVASIFSPEEQTLQNSLLAKRGELIRAGMDDDAIELEMKRYEIQQKVNIGLVDAKKALDEKKIGQKQYNDLVAQLNNLLPTSNKLLGEQNALLKDNAYGKRIEDLKEQIRLLLIINTEERRLAELTKEFDGDAIKAQEIFNLEKIKKNIEETRALIDDFVSSTTSDYKGFLKAVISGEDAADALKQFQEGLTDKVLTIFLDFAMAPIEKSLKEGLFSFFKPKVDPKLLEQQKSVTALADNTAATRANTNALKGLQGGAAGAAQALPVIPFGESADAATQSMSTISEAFSSGLSTVNTSAQGWNQALNFGLPSVISTSAQQIGQQGGVLGNSLGSVTGVIGAAASSIMGIVAGVSQMGSGGTSGVLGGIGSIFMGLGGALGGIGGMFGGGLSSAFSGGASSAIGTGASGWSTAFATPLRFANGGMVTGPTLGLVGEGKYNEAIVPLPDGRSIPVQMKGASGGGLREAMSGNNGKASGSPILNMSFQSTNINGVEYVSRDQLEAAMATTRKQAAKDGANRGMSMTLDKLQQSPQTRNRLGMR
jgi:tape measure domain-containing protein